jgi:hypothetical protein
VIRLINAYFVPVYTSMEDYVGSSAAVPEEERRAYQSILRSAHAKKLSTGTVHLYFVSPEGEALDSIHVAHAKPEKVIASLKATIESLGTAEGKPLTEPRPQAAWPKAAPDALSLHLVARAVAGRAGGFWGELPGENFIVYSRSEWRAFLPPEGAAPGARWEIDRAVALKLLNYFYPSTENNEISTNEVLESSMKGTLLEAGRVRLDATLRMKHPFYHKKDEATVDAVAAGIVELDSVGARIRKFRMATERATYNGGTFGVSVSGPP